MKTQKREQSETPMFERYTERARRVLFFARYEASQLGNRSITPEHLLLGLVREGEGLTSRIYSRAGLTPEGLRREIQARLVFEEKLPTSVEIPFTDATKRALQFAALEADRLLHNYIGTEHLLLGLLHERRSIAAEILYAHGLGLDEVREAIVTALNEPADGVVSAVRTRESAGQTNDVDAAALFAGGTGLRSLLARALNIESSRIEAPREFDRPLVIRRERRSVDAYVLTVAPGRTLTSADTASGGGGGVSLGSVAFSTASTLSREEIPQPTGQASLHALGPLSLRGTTMGELARMLEEVLGCAVIDESGLDGRYDLEVSGPHQGLDAFLTALQSESGLLLTRATREIEMVVVTGK